MDPELLYKSVKVVSSAGVEYVGTLTKLSPDSVVLSTAKMIGGLNGQIEPSETVHASLSFTGDDVDSVAPYAAFPSFDASKLPKGVELLGIIKNTDVASSPTAAAAAADDGRVAFDMQSGTAAFERMRINEDSRPPITEAEAGGDDLWSLLDVPASAPPRAAAVVPPSTKEPAAMSGFFDTISTSLDRPPRRGRGGGRGRGRGAPEKKWL